MGRLTYIILVLVIQIGIAIYLSKYNLNMLEFLLIFVPVPGINYLHGLYVGQEANIKKYFEDED